MEKGFPAGASLTNKPQPVIIEALNGRKDKRRI
jgi:hypothetical protein